MGFELATSPSTRPHASSAAPPSAAPPRPPLALQGTAAGLDRWREATDGEDDDWAPSGPRKEAKGKARAVPGEDFGRAHGEVRDEIAALRAKRAVASESWDDDFDFHAPPIASPRRASSRAPSSSRSRPTTPLHRQTSSASHIPSTPTSRRGSPPASPRRGLSVGGPATLSLDSLASSIAWASDQDPTVTVVSSTAAAADGPARSPSREPHQSHRPSASTATARPPLSRQTTPRTRIPKLSPSLSVGASQPSWTDSAPYTDSDYRTDTPCLTEDSFNSLTTAEDEVVTEHEGDGAHELAATPSRPPDAESTLGSRLKSIGGSKKWSFGRRSSVVKGAAAQQQKQTMPPPPPPSSSSRRVGTPEVMVVDRHELSRARLSNSPRSQLPRPVSRSTAGGKGSASTFGSASSSQQQTQRDHQQQQPRAPHSSSTSTSTSSTSAGRPRRTSLHFAPPPLVPPLVFRRGSLASTRSPTESVAFSWREYSGTTTEGDEDDEDDGETTGADPSDFSGDEGARRPRRRVARSAKGAARLADAITPSTSFATTSTRPVSPVDSILGADRSRWNASQVSFASSASAFALRSAAPQGAFVAGPGADATHGQGQKRKLTKRRPSSGLSPGSSAHDHLVAGSLGTASDRPLLAPSIFSNSSGGSSQPSSSRTVLHRARSYPRPPPPALPFADDSDAERAPRQRSVTNPVQQHGVVERGQVVEVEDPEWLGVMPFPPSLRASLEARASALTPTATLSAAPSRSSRILRKVSGAAPESHPPVTGRTQGEAKARRGSGLGQALSSLLSRSTSALPLGGGSGGGGKRAPSPAPSGKSVKSSKSGLLRRPSSRASRVTVDEASTPPLPKSPSLSALRKRSSVFGPAPPLPTSASVPVLPAPTSPRPLVSTTASSPGAVPRSSSTFSFLRRPRAFSRTATKDTPSSAVSPASPQKRSSHQPPLDSTPRPCATSSGHPQRRAQASPRGQLNHEFKMPRPAGAVSTAFSSAGGTVNTTAPTTMAFDGHHHASTARLGQARTLVDIPPVPPLPRSVRARPGAAPMGHRPSVSLSSIMPLRSASPRPSLARAQPSTPEHRLALDEPLRPVTALGGAIERYIADDELDSGDELALPRRNSLGDLRIPARITNAQKKIEEDLERVKQFAKAVEELKALRRQYDQLIYIFAERTSPPTHLPLDRPSADALHKTAQAARRVEIDYSAWWEQAQTLIDLGDGKPTKDKASPGTLASRRDRCVSLAPEVTPPRARSVLALPSESETETEATAAAAGALGRNGSVAHRLRRRPSASSIETEASVAVRQREMLRGVLAPTMKGASLPSRAPPAPRPPLPRLDPGLSTSKRMSGVPLGVSHTLSPSTPSSPAAKSLSPAATRRVSRGGVPGIREFLFRLRSKATEELAASVGSIPAESPTHPFASSTPSLGRRSVSDPSSRPRTPLRAAGSSTLRTSAPPLAPVSRSSPRRTSSTSESDEDWDADLADSVGSPPSRSSMLDLDLGVDGSVSAAVSARRERTRSVIVSGAGSGAGSGRGKGGEMMVLTTEAMPHLLAKVREVREACEACIGLLKGLTV
ncbi:hypothetical protein JCM9279_006904 [Rhodotorula babjevae]